MQDAWRAYLELALGLTEAPRKRAQDAARRLAGTGGATAVQLQALAEELLATGAANREALTKLVRFEVDRALGAVGLATADEVAELTRRVHELERQLREARNGPVAVPAGDAAPDTTAPADGAAGTAGAVRASGGAAGAAGAAAQATGSTAETAGGEPGAAAPSPLTVAKKAVAKKAVAKKAVAKKAVAKKAVQKPVPADPSAGSGTPGEDPTPPSRPPRKAAPGRGSPGGAG
ncbi:hypothetical protein [Micromonospora sp. WMMD714]|uniref:phasin family protein n=1 Tax=Micromonospora sp. WMMD714 TaxID=3016097 RepID=UPI00249B3826|nr:hypothetical protein [Micromonospora sp. WMMD714]WFE66596.1 hypothetical protein O7625_26300 [Micromonospora sp. WMMD714]